jgi:hypothetical protein
MSLEDVAQPTRIRGELVSDNYFRVLGATALVGRLIGDVDTTDAPVAVLSYETWRNRFGGDPHVVGRAIQLGLERLAIIGVASPGFQDPAYPSEFWAPLASTSQLLGEDLSRMHVPYLQTIARPRPGVTRQQVQAYIASIPTNESRDGWRLAALPGTYLRFWPA